MQSTGTGSSDPARTVRRAGKEPASPWEDFDAVMEKMLELIGVSRPAGHRSRSTADEADAAGL
ncbi:hypothetical protein [Streptomyces antimicrobicus]|uniref:Uncharacterized protein n=1 Tax=Streptomyces antimicrobicus TaxID=2883108 RepID=A0ABS8B3Q6_9ACTN|nr:hypothetical protein [Streptomyces antimicrobicus]MCB5179214.1 hypothetical protein [Streptomyces antimicrobicus]